MIRILFCLLYAVAHRWSAGLLVADGPCAIIRAVGPVRGEKWETSLGDDGREVVVRRGLVNSSHPPSLAFSGVAQHAGEKLWL